MSTTAAYRTAHAAIADPLLARRPVVQDVCLWVAQATLGANRLNASSQQLLGRIMRQSWKVLDTLREADATNGSSVDDQLNLGRVVGALVLGTMLYGARYNSATGLGQLTLTQGSASALALLEAYDPVIQGAANFDLVAALRRLIFGARLSAR